MTALLQIFSKTDPDVLFGLISSDLDCDRLDYLRRSAHGCGVPFGEVDVDFIISKATVDKDGILCFQSKAAAAIDHFLISRFYDYMQVVYHKTVVGLEWSLDCCVLELLKRKLLKINSNDVLNLVKNGNWQDVDDNWILIKFKELYSSLKESSGSSVICDHLKAVLYRKPAKLVFQWEDLQEKAGKEARLYERIVAQEVEKICKKLEIDRARFKIIARKPFPFSSDLSISTGQALSPEEQARSVSILDKRKRKSTLLSARPGSLIGSMSAIRNFSVRVFYLPQDGEDRSVRDNIRKQLEKVALA